MSERPTPDVPQDEILAHLLRNFPDLVYKYHVHESLLENKVEQDLSEKEKNEAWEIYLRDLEIKTMALQKTNSNDLTTDGQSAAQYHAQSNSDQKSMPSNVSNEAQAELNELNASFNIATVEQISQLSSADNKDKDGQEPENEEQTEAQNNPENIVLERNQLPIIIEKPTTTSASYVAQAELNLNPALVTQTPQHSSVADTATFDSAKSVPDT